MRSDHDLAVAVAESNSVLAVLKKLGVSHSGASHAHISRRIKKLSLDTSHFRNGGETTSDRRRLSAEKLLVRNRSDQYRERTLFLKRALLEIGRAYECEVCGGKPIWNGEPLSLEIDHKDGDRINNTRENLRFICPNCHAQTENYKNTKKTVVLS